VKYNRNIWLVYVITAFTGLSFATALVVPFFNSNGLNQAKIQVLQTIFSLAAVVFEVPTGYIADRYSRAACVRLGSLVLGAGFLSYAFARTFTAFVVLEVALALGIALGSGADQALVFDGLLADGAGDRIRKFNANRQSVMFGSMVLFAPLGSLLAAHVGIRPIIALDGSLALVACACGFLLKEPPRLSGEEDPIHHPVESAKVVARHVLRGHPQLPWLILLGAALNGATYFGFWLAPSYYSWVGIPVVWFGLILGVRSAVKALLSQLVRRLGIRFSDEGQLYAYALLSVFSYVGLALLQAPAAIVFMLGFDIVQALQSPIISEKLNFLSPSHIRAQVLSVAALVNRATYALLGPLFGWGVDHNMRFGLILCAAVFAPLCLGSLAQLKKKGVL
jgi:MFS family permease